jgi:Oxidoreductase FAD-binding domain
MRVTGKKRESGSVTSLLLEPTDGHPLTPGLPGQFIVLRLRPTPDAPPLLRSYSLSGEPSNTGYRVSVKRNPDGVAGAYIGDEVRVGDLIEVSAPRGSFTLGGGDGPVILLSAGIGVTPVLAMLHALAAVRSPREVCGSTEPMTARSIRLPRKCAPASERCPTSTAISATAHPVPRTGKPSILTPLAAWEWASLKN